VLPHWIGLGESQAVISANASLGPGQGTQTDASIAQMHAAESDMLSAAQNGVPNDPNAQGQLAFSIALGVAAYACAPCAGFMAGLYALAQAIAPELYNIGLLTPPHCTRTGPAAQTSDWPQPSTTTTPGIPAALWPVVVDQITRQANCGAYIPSAILYQNFAGIWNQAHAPTANVAMAVVPYGGPMPMQNLLEALPYFGMPWDESLWRYTTMSQSDQLSMGYWKQQGALVELDFNNGPLLPGHGPTSPAAQTPQSNEYHGALTSSSSGGLSTGGKVAAGAAIAAGGVLVSSAAYAAATHQSFVGLWGRILRGAKFW
jgi:hypothetical protein